MERNKLRPQKPIPEVIHKKDDDEDSTPAAPIITNDVDDGVE